MSGVSAERMGIVFVLAALTLLTLSHEAHADGCPPPSVAITPATRDAATAAGIPTSSACWDPNDANTGQAAGDAKAWLMQHATKNSNIACLNSTFAERLEKFMQAVPGGPPTITDGYRDPGKQAALVQGGASQAGYCQSYHNYGMAADFNNTSASTLLWMRLNAPQYGLTPIPSLNVQNGCSYNVSANGKRFCDPAHIQIQGPHPSADQCGICATTGGNGTLPGGGAQQPYPDDAYYYTGQNQNPFIAQPQQMPFQPMTPIQPTQPTLQPTTTQPIPFITASSTLPSLLLTNTNVNTNTNGTDTAQALLDALGDTSTSATPGVAPAISLNLNGGAQLLPTPQPMVPVQYNPTAAQPIAQQTFTSGDLGGNGGPAIPPQTSTFSPVQQILASMRSVLLGMLSYLQNL